MIVKGAVGILLLAAIGLALAYYGGGVSSFDPTAAGKEAMESIQAGMPFEEVLEVAGTPPRYRVIMETKKKVDGEMVTFLEPGPSIRFQRDLAINDFRNNQMPHGFILNYKFSERLAFDVELSGEGKVQGVTEAKTMADMLEARDD